MKANTRESIIKRKDNRYKLQQAMTRRTLKKNIYFAESSRAPFQINMSIISRSSSSDNSDAMTNISDFEGGDLGLTGSLFRSSIKKAKQNTLASGSTRDFTPESKINSMNQAFESESIFDDRELKKVTSLDKVIFSRQKKFRVLANVSSRKKSIMDLSCNKRASDLQNMTKVSKFQNKVLNCQKTNKIVAMSSQDFDHKSMSRISTELNFNVKKIKPTTQTTLLEMQNISISNQKPCTSHLCTVKNFRYSNGKWMKGTNFSSMNKTAGVNFVIKKSFSKEFF